MNDFHRGQGRDDHERAVHEVRRRLADAVDDVEPAPDALPRLLSEVRRRRSPRRPLIAAAVAGAAAVTAVVVAIVQVGPPRPEPAGVAPNSYVAQPEPGVIATFDVGSGRQLDRIARTPVPGGTIAADEDRVYVVLQNGAEQGIVEIDAAGEQRIVEPLSEHRDVRAFAAGAGTVAYAGNREVVVGGGGTQRRIAVPPGLDVLDLAVGDDGRIAVLTRSQQGHTQVHVGSEATELAALPTVPTPGDCGAIAVEWTGTEVAALSPVDCDRGERFRVSTFDPGSGEVVGGGVPFSVAGHRVDADSVQLSTDKLGRFLVSASGTPQWLIDGGTVDVLPAPCSEDTCATTPATFWG
ncbi:hypothetical protein GIY23_07090 [Allosaccharopolyspora coralli]|uniref:FbpC C-terminal regulatory nucleotide binding domain-containing protein n=1 Tax=Allosaccharopolyspora coralli TaxID=2665642 RepID=A0A5Q3QCW4_9PSEU|nr:hypothetical protein [Allosaccharopolyspora coralli]QGK69325.1 hypothetical protein GIY23_07090 [Allosaccharopolyspora coralli]